MKLSVKRMMAALMIGALLSAPAGVPLRFSAYAAEDKPWSEMSDQEKEEYEKQQQEEENDEDLEDEEDDKTATQSREDERAGSNLPRWAQNTDRATTRPTTKPATGATTVTSIGAFETSSKVPAKQLMAQVSSYKEKNDAVVGWLYVPGTNINEPIVLDADQANAYYETRTWDGTNYPDNDWTNYRITATFADRRVQIGSSWKSTSRNIVLYGHNWTNLRNPLDIGNVPQHVMFGQLPSYTNQDFAKQNPYVYFTTAENEGIWKVFAAFYCEEASSFNYNAPNPTPEVYAANLAEFKNRSIYDFDTEVDQNDRMITLSTCTRVYGDHAQQRFVVMARLLREGESDTDPVSVTVNADMKKPLL